MEKEPDLWDQYLEPTSSDPSLDFQKDKCIIDNSVYISKYGEVVKYLS